MGTLAACEDLKTQDGMSAQNNVNAFEAQDAADEFGMRDQDQTQSRTAR
jgi:hypothetical protein